MRFRHVKRGTDYELIDIIEYNDGVIVHEGEIIYIMEDGEEVEYNFQCSSNRGAWAGGLLVLYYPLKEAGLWARPATEFFDGRFKRI